MKRKIRILFAQCAVSLCAASAWADVVHITYQTSTGGTVSTVAEAALETGCAYTTVPAPTKSGYIFTHWTISTKQDFAARDVWGRAYDAPSFMLYEDTTLTAHYLPASRDSDGDGIPDGWELYWYGDLAPDAASDTDGDGATFAEELANGTNPLFPDTSESGGVSRALSGTFLYNPHRYAPVVVRSEPEGRLCTTTTNYCSTGDLQRTPTLSVANGFAYWTVDGVAQRDAFGRALDQVVINPDAAHVTEAVAHYVADKAVRWSLYWYGRTDIAMDSDTDGDGYTFAEELANGTNPHFPDTSESGGVSRALSGTFLYNPHDYAPVVVRSEPAGALFTTATNYVTAGDIQRTDAPSIADGFAYWTVDGVEQRDAFGRALDQAVVTPDSGRVLDVIAHYVADEAARLSYYWYGRPDVAMDSDTDGDGFTFSEEIANGTNPHFPDTTEPGGIAYADSDTLEANLQPFDPATGAVVGEAFEELFTSPFAGNAATSRTFGNPTFTRDDTVATNGLDLAQGSLAALDGLTLDVPPTDAVSCAFGDVDQDGIADLLVSDAEGRIWFYRGLGENAFALQHKVWGGSHAGFAPRLTIALVDWDGDGDLDCVCGTADGKLMLLVDPRVGRPTNVQATAGVDSVVLTWDPNGNSRVRGYGVYRGADTNAYDRIEAQWPLPRYRDVPEVVQDYYYRVTSVSRFYTSGNSTPTTSESLPTDAVYVQFRPHVWLTGTSGFTGSNVTVIVSMNNSMGISAEGLSLTFAYDPAVLAPRGIRTTGLTAGLVAGGTATVPSAGTWCFAAQGGEIATGAGRFLLLDFTILPVHDVTETTVTLTAATVKALDGRAVTLDLPQSATVEISDSDPLVPAIVAVHVADAAVDSETTFDLPVTVTATETLTNFAATVSWDETLLELKGIQTGFTGLTGLDEDLVNPVNPVKNSYAFQTSGGDFALKFYAKDPASAATNFAARVSLTGVAANDCHGFAVSAADAAGMVLIKNAHPWVPARVSVTTEDRKVDTLEEVVVPFKVTSDVALTQGTFTVEWDDAVLELKGIQTGLTGLTGLGENLVNPVNPVKNSCVVQTAGGDFALTFRARDQHDVTMTQVRLTSATVTDAHGFTLAPSVPVVATILVHDAHPLIPAQVAMTLDDVRAMTETEFEMTLAISSTEALTNLVLALDYDTELLELRSGVLNFAPRVPSTVTLRFYAKENHTVASTVITVRPQRGFDHNGLAAVLPTEVTGTVVLTDSNPWVPAMVSVGVGNVSTETGLTFEMPVTVTATETLTNFAAKVEWDADVLELKDLAGATAVRAPSDGTATLSTAGGGFTLTFYAKEQYWVSNTVVSVVAAEAVDNHGLTAHPIAVPVSGTVYLQDLYSLQPAEVAMSLACPTARTMEEFDVKLQIMTTETLTNLTLAVDYDEAVLDLRSAQLAYVGSVPDEVTLRFYAKEQHDVASTVIAVVPRDGIDCHERVAKLPTRVEGVVALVDSNPWVPATVSVGVGSVSVETRTTFEMPVTLTSSERLTNFTATVEWDADVLELKGVQTGLDGNPVNPVNPVKNSYALQTSGSDFALTFYAKDQHTVTRTAVRLTGLSAVDAHGLAAHAIADAAGTVLIRDAHPLVSAGVVLNVSTVYADTLSAFTVPIPVTSTKVLTNLSVTVGWDANVLELRGVSGGAFLDGTPSAGAAKVGAKGTVPGTLYLTFYAKDQHTVTETSVTLSEASAWCLDGLAARITTVDGTVHLTDANAPVPVEMLVRVGGAKGQSGQPFAIGVAAATSGDLAELTVEVDWDASLMSFSGCSAAQDVVALSENRRRLVFACTGNYNLFNLDFTAAAIPNLRTNGWIRLVAASGVGKNGLPAVVTTELPHAETVLIVREIGKYDPGDVDGDGAYTNADYIILRGYISYLTFLKKGAVFANAFADGYRQQYGVDVRLTGAAARAADVNCDGAVTSSDLSMLQMLIRESEGGMQ